MKNKIIENAVNGTLNADFGKTDAQLERQCWGLKKIMISTMKCIF